MNTRVNCSNSLSSGVEFRNRIFFGDDNNIEGVLSALKDDGRMFSTSTAW